MKKKDENRIVQYILDQKKIAEDATSARRDAWKELWQLYQNKQDWSNKENWQSRCFIPKVYMTVEQSSAIVKRAILSTRRLFKLEPIDPQDQEAIVNVKPITDKFINALEDSNFADVYGEMAKGAFLLGVGFPKILWDNGLRYYNVDAANMYVCPSYEPSQPKPPSFMVEYIELGLDELKEKATKINQQAEQQIYDLKTINKLQSDYADLEYDYDKWQRRGLDEHRMKNKRVAILQYWGDIVIDDEVERNQVVEIANMQYIIRKQPNPFLFQRAPYQITVPLVYPHRGVAGVSLVEPVVSLQYTFNNIVNMMVDNLNFTVNKVYEFNTNNALNPTSITNVYPGKLISKFGEGKVLDQVETSGIGNDVFNTLLFLNAEIEKGTAVTEFIMGYSGKNKTATEAELKTSQAQGLFDIIARDLEANSLKPLLEMSFDLLCQFEVIEPQWRDRYKLRVGGLSLLLAQSEQRQRITEKLMAALQSPELRKMTNLENLYQKWLELDNLQDIYTEQAQMPTIDQTKSIQEMAANDAKNYVSQLSPEQIMQMQGV